MRWVAGETAFRTKHEKVIQTAPREIDEYGGRMHIRARLWERSELASIQKIRRSHVGCCIPQVEWPAAKRTLKPEKSNEYRRTILRLTPLTHCRLSRHCHPATAEREMEQRVVDPSLQREKVQQALNAAELKPRATYYIISQKWWSAWRDYVACDKTAADGSAPGIAGTQSVEALSLDDSRLPTIPGPISNEPLCEALAGSARPLLRQGLVELDDYAVSSHTRTVIYDATECR